MGRQKCSQLYHQGAFSHNHYMTVSADNSNHNASCRKNLRVPFPRAQTFPLHLMFSPTKECNRFCNPLWHKKTTVFQSSDAKIAKINKVVMLNVPILLLSKPLNQNKHVFLLSPTRSWGAFAVKKNNSKTANQQGCNATKSPSKETSQPILHVPSRVPKDSNLFPTRSAISLQFTWGAFAVKTNKTAIISKAAMLKPTRLQCYQISFYGNFWKGYG